MPDLGKAYVQIVPSAQGIKGSITSVLGGEVSSAGEAAKSILGSKLAMGALAGGAAVAKVGQEIVKFASDAVQVGMGFDSSMSQVAATMGTTVDQIGDLRDYAKEMGATTAFSATQAADALNYMALAGYDAQTSMDMLPNVLNLAAAGSIELARASDMVTDAQSALGLSLDDTNVLVDQMARASSKSNTSVAQLGDAILTIGATARNVKGGTAELATVLGVLADNGIKGAEGGTHLRNILLSLQTPTTAGTAALAQLGMTYDDMYDAAGNMRAIPEIMLQLQASMEGMTQASKDAIISGIFNKTDLASVNALIGTSAERFDELSGSIENSAGAAQAMADTQLDNLAGDITLWESAVEGLQIAVADKLNPALRFFVELGTDVVGGLTEIIDGFDNGVPSVDELTQSTQAFYDTVENGKTNLDETSTSIEATALMADRYITALEGMGDTANMTAAEHQQYHNYLVLLTEAIPELAGIIDLETDSIDGGTAALRENTAEWEANAMAKAGEEYLSELYQKQADLLWEQADLSVRAQKNEEDLAAATQRRTELLEEITALQESHANGEYSGFGGGDKYLEDLGALQSELDAVNTSITNLETEQENLSQSTADNAQAISDADAELSSAQDTVDEYNRLLSETEEATRNQADAEENAQAILASSVETMNEATQALEGIGTAADEALLSGGDLRASYEELSGQLDALEGDLDAETLAMVQQKLAVLDLAATNQELIGSYPLLVARMQENKQSLTDLSALLIANGITAEEWGQQVTAATDGVVNGFQLLDTSLGMDLDTMYANLEQNITAHREWRENLSELWAAAEEDGSAGALAFVQYMADMGIGAATEVAAMVEDTDATLAEFAPLFAKAMDEGMFEVQNSIENADVGTSAEGISQEVVDQLESADYSAAGEAVASGVATGVSGASGEISVAVGGVMESAVTTVSGVDFSTPMRAALDGAADVISGTDLASPSLMSMDGMIQAIQGSDLTAPMGVVMDGAVDTVTNTDFAGPGSDISRNLASGIRGGSYQVSSAAQSAVSSARASAYSAAQGFYDVGYSMDQGMVRGLQAGSGAVQSAAAQVAQQALSAAKQKLDINSPSKVFRDVVGMAIPEGIAAGIRKGTNFVTDGVAALADKAVGAFSPDGVDLGAYTMAARAAADGTYAPGKSTNITNYFTVSGAENPEAFADRLARRLSMQIRMG